MDHPFPIGKLPPAFLNSILANAPQFDRRVLLGPGIGLDCAVVDMGDRYWVFKADPITFATDQIGWYAVQVASNDIATTGATPRFMLLTLLLPEGKSDEALVRSISDQVFSACNQHQITVLGGHTEVTHGIDRPLLVITLIGEVLKDRLVTPRGARPGDALLLTKGIPIEATSLLAREFPDRLAQHLTSLEIRQAADFLYHPGIGVFRDAQIALQAGKVTAMHDPTEGGLSAALWEMAQACGQDILFDPSAVTIPSLAARICLIFGLDPFATIASGALLLAVQPSDAEPILNTLRENDIAASRIGEIVAGDGKVFTLTGTRRILWPYPDRDEIGKVFD
ncbi:hydrogenase maturation factor [Longilinea arvoryzae]|uniref:Hydrogenase maturation factor n=1 Tax=Longilinea arvoryzae TaxID=360412 RepID=A0A0S7BAN1_9CHLR|nr:AIR synthase family protein [Longilinea arvoryzae]GAP14542.1 hydrogenase maturation factor [Longilinea arvoryzae]